MAMTIQQFKEDLSTVLAMLKIAELGQRFDNSEIKKVPFLTEVYATSCGMIISTRKQNAVIRRPIKNDKGYNYHTFYESGKNKNITEHKIICTAFHGLPPPGKPYVRHLDGSRDNNRPDNLMWGSSSENSRDAIKHGTHVGLNSGPRVTRQLFGKGTGTTFIKTGKRLKRWNARIKFNKKTISLGYFETELEAKCAYLLAVEKYKPIVFGGDK